ncbi:unnamed protein product [Adineta ricciae]|uniref:Uncharacterized protein n=1 Tax=Adineta ricciae TaxID=249248 RepID=A0A815I0B3_ADIRI|nr:unnamed protein product [Adineta ricciae]CAF1390711.1 unnamed protein product [Adineta ricciae]
MSKRIESKSCQANTNGKKCDKDPIANCFHCSYNLCLKHLTEHTQLVESQSQTFFESNGTILNDFSKKLSTLSISPRVLELPFLQLEKWRHDAHEKLDELAEQKRQEIHIKIAEYRAILTKQVSEQKHQLDKLKRYLNDLSRQTNLATKDMKSFENQLNETRQFLTNVEKHSIQLSTEGFSVHIQTHYFETNISQPIQRTDSIRSARSEKKESPVSNGLKRRFIKKRSLSVCLL